MTMTMVNNVLMLRRKLLLSADNRVLHGHGSSCDVHIDYLCDHLALCGRLAEEVRRLR